LCADILTQQRDLFTQIKARTQFAHGLLASGGFFQPCRLKQPLSESIFTGGGAGGAEQFEEAAFSKEVEIFGVYVISVTKALAGLAFALPLMLDAVETAVVVAQTTFGEGATAYDARVLDE
jgi:hypothetical protein